MRVSAGMPDSDVDTPGLGLVREPVSDAIEFFVALEAALALVWHNWVDNAREATALAGCVPLKAVTRAPGICRMRPWRCVIVPLAPFLQPKTWSAFFKKE